MTDKEIVVCGNNVYVPVEFSRQLERVLYVTNKSLGCKITELSVRQDELLQAKRELEETRKPIKEANYWHKKFSDTEQRLAEAEKDSMRLDYLLKTYTNYYWKGLLGLNYLPTTARRGVDAAIAQEKK